MPPLDINKRTETKKCECGCEETILRYRLKLRDGLPNGYYERRFKNGHSMKNKKHSKEHSQKISTALKGKKRETSWNKGKSNWWCKGELNNNWKGGITPETTKCRNKSITIEWRKTIFKLFDYECQICRAKNGNGKKIILNAHHIKTWSEYPNLRWDLKNGICLCEKCHNQIRGNEKKLENLFLALIENRVKTGELLIDKTKDNPVRSSLNGIKVSENVQRLTNDEPTNKFDKSARYESNDIVCTV